MGILVFIAFVVFISLTLVKRARADRNNDEEDKDRIVIRSNKNKLN